MISKNIWCTYVGGVGICEACLFGRRVVSCSWSVVKINEVGDGTSEAVVPCCACQCSDKFSATLIKDALVTLGTRLKVPILAIF